MRQCVLQSCAQTKVPRYLCLAVVCKAGGAGQVLS